MRFHTSLPVENIPQTVDFYRVLFESEPAKLKPDYVKFMPDSLDLNISFHQKAEGAGSLAGLHLGLELPSQADLDRIHAKLSAHGLISAERQTSVCCYANQDKFWVTDPNGYKWEVYVLLEDTSLKMSDSVSCCAPKSAVSSTGSCC